MDSSTSLDDSSNGDLPNSDADADIGQTPIRRRTPYILALAFIAFVAAVALALELFVAERLPELNVERLEAARATWEQAGPRSYDLDLEIQGERPGPVHVEVRGGEVTEVTINGRAPSPHTRHTWTVEGQFHTLEQELLLAEDPVHQMQIKIGASLRLRCEFDAKYGFPRAYQRTVSGGGPDVFWRVTSFIPR
jgi:hypothetical protein